MVVPKFRKKVQSFLSSEDGSVLNKKVLKMGVILAGSTISLLSQNISAHSTHCSGGVNELGYNCINDGLAGVISHSTHGSHGSHTSHSTHSAHNTHSNHSTHNSHGSHCTHSTHGSHSNY